MSLRFWLGGEGSDRSARLIEYIVDEAEKNPKKQYLFIAPEQFGLTTQRELVNKSRNKGILNIDVLSFSRFAHRIMDEVGSYDNEVVTLDELGKNLILQLIATANRKELEVFGKNIDRIGYVGKIKSIISEFMQYGIDAARVEKMAADAKLQGKGTLSAKLNDIFFLYQKFGEFIYNKYTTTEETLQRVESIIYMSQTVKNSVIVFEGFTGFTPVQNRLIGKLLEYAPDIHVSLVMSKGENEDLFGLSRKTISHLEKMAEERRVIVLDPYVAPEVVPGYKVSFLSENNPENEIKLVVLKIKELVHKKGYRFSDFAIIAGDVDSYRTTIGRVFERSQIPYFIDKTQALLMNPFIEYIRALIEIFSDNYSYESVFRFLKTGMTGIDESIIFKLENYCLAKGIKGAKKWHTRFTTPSRDTDGDELLELEEIRQAIIDRLDDFVREAGDIVNAGTKSTVRNFSVALYNRIIADGIEDRLKEYAEYFALSGDLAKAEEYKQIYRKIMDVLDELISLIPDEQVDVRAYGDLLDAGFDGIRIGIAPRGRDYVQVGDLTRSRITHNKVLFIIGACDGVIPQTTSKSGIINDAEREFLLSTDSELVLAPTAREDAFTQRLYIYMATHKPSDELIVSYPRMSFSGVSQMPSYIFKELKEQYPATQWEKLPDSIEGRIGSKEDAFYELAGLLKESVSSGVPESTRMLTRELLKWFLDDPQYRRRTRNLAYQTLIRDRIGDDNIGAAIATAIYGKKLYGSITRLEVYANCAYQYFLQYGMRLKEREQFDFESRDMGNIFHEALAQYSKLVSDADKSWFTVSNEESDAFMDRAVDIAVAKGHIDVLSENARSAYMINRIKRIMRRTGEIITGQIQKGEFEPKYFEVDFDKLESINSIKFTLSETEEMRLQGRIDRVDLCEKDDAVYIKIIDYKSSGHVVDLAAIYEGRQLQLLVYLNAAMENEALKTGKEVVPAGVLYYHIDDPILEENEVQTEEAFHNSVMKKLRLRGLLNTEDNGKAIELMDADLASGSNVVSAGRNKEGLITSRSKDLVTREELDLLRNYVNTKITQIGREILDGNVKVPEADGVNRFTEPECGFCEYRAVCLNRAAGQADEPLDDEESGRAETVPTAPATMDFMEMIRNTVE